MAKLTHTIPGGTFEETFREHTVSYTPDEKPCQVTVKTGSRTHTFEPGNMGEAEFLQFFGAFELTDTQKQILLDALPPVEVESTFALKEATP